jgi:NAD(P)-dependent dehydrogenase (short-subunit alcohol dehydrogenase family)
MPSDTSRLAFVTGTSSGIGEALAQELLRREWNVIGAARRPAKFAGERYTHFTVDLRDVSATTAALDSGLGPRLAAPGVARLGLVNNAAHIALLGPVAQMNVVDLLEVYAVNVALPIWLMGLFMRRGEVGTPLRIVNVSTGAAVRPFPGLGAYATSKAALRMAGMVLATEIEAVQPDPGQRRDTTILSYEPGVVDTEMQVAARSASSQILPSVDAFKQFAAQGLLAPAAAPAREIADYLDGDGHSTFSERRYGAPPAGTAP